MGLAERDILQHHRDLRLSNKLKCFIKCHHEIVKDMLFKLIPSSGVSRHQEAVIAFKSDGLSIFQDAWATSDELSQEFPRQTGYPALF
ncbi:hypothetical protein CEXT_480501 [Caerostris extrusa]|uniref:Uncharacterized protein n=1 Tax=Caerostris extrusa TaxID=172846 RepID=A0AAV4PUV0_CAEEX|nr:hypothetical protein CEXT_480501 [Caerostris extrusa]